MNYKMKIIILMEMKMLHKILMEKKVFIFNLTYYILIFLKSN